jgi:Uma2 family endonuclease
MRTDYYLSRKGEPMTVATDRRMTLKEYLDYDDDTDTRYELEDGVLVEMGAETPLNPRIAMMLVFIFSDLGMARKLLAIGHQIEVRSRYATARQPDLVIHTVESDEALSGNEKVLRLGAPSPLLIVEVASQTLIDAKSRKRDYEQKPSEYADRGIPEMWIVDPDRAWVKVGTLVDDAHQFETFRGDEAIVSPTFPQLDLTAAQVLSAGR